jgi:hypothetical protein
MQFWRKIKLGCHGAENAKLGYMFRRNGRGWR